MSVLITRTGFARETYAGTFQQFDAIEAVDTALPAALEIAAGFDVASLRPHLDRLELIRITFQVFSDGRGFSQARQLRMLGFHGRLRATGHLIADQFPMLLRSGFDEVEISDAHALRQPESQWLAALARPNLDYQHRLRQFAPFENPVAAAR